MKKFSKLLILVLLFSFQLSLYSFNRLSDDQDFYKNDMKLKIIYTSFPAFIYRSFLDDRTLKPLDLQRENTIEERMNPNLYESFFYEELVKKIGLSRFKNIHILEDRLFLSQKSFNDIIKDNELLADYVLFIDLQNLLLYASVDRFNVASSYRTALLGTIKLYDVKNQKTVITKNISNTYVFIKGDDGTALSSTLEDLYDDRFYEKLDEGTKRSILLFIDRILNELGI